MLTLLSRVICTLVGTGFIAGVVLYILRLANL